MLVTLNDVWPIENDDLIAANAELANIRADGHNLRESIKRYLLETNRI
jgi:hypothetical protein